MALGAQLNEMIHALSELMGAHVKLAKAELKQDAKQLGVQGGKIAAFVPVVLLGYALSMVAVALSLGRLLPLDASFAIVGGAHLLLGGLGIALAARSLSKAQPMQHTRLQLEESVEVVRSAASNGAQQTLERR